MKFDCIVGNPPYGVAQKGNTPTQHLKIMKKALTVCSHKLTFIMPSRPLVRPLEKGWYDMFKNAVCTHIEVMSKEIFPTTEMDNTAIYYCDRLENPENYCRKLDVDENLYEAVGEVGRMFIDKMGSFGQVYIYEAYNMHGHKKGSKWFEGRFGRICESLKQDKWYLNVNRAAPVPGSRYESNWISNTLKKTGILTKEEEKSFMYEHTGCKNILECPTKEYGENLKYLMCEGLVLKYSLWLTQIHQNLINIQFRYVPDLDYTNIHTDYELLTACGFTEEETKKVMDYLKHFDFTQNRNDLIRNFEK